MRSFLEVAQELARAHRLADPKTSIIKYFPPSKDKDSILRLLEVSQSVPTVGEILPYSFAAAPSEQIDYPSTVILVSQDEWHSIQDGRLTLPQDWDLHKAQDL